MMKTVNEFSEKYEKDGMLKIVRVRVRVWVRARVRVRSFSAN